MEAWTYENSISWIKYSAKYIVTQDKHYDVVRFNPKYDFTAVDIDYFLGYLQKSFWLFAYSKSFRYFCEVNI